MYGAPSPPWERDAVDRPVDLGNVAPVYGTPSLPETVPVVPRQRTGASAVAVVAVVALVGVLVLVLIWLAVVVGL